MTAPGRLDDAGGDVEAVLDYTRLAAEAVTGGSAGYAMLLAEKPG